MERYLKLVPLSLLVLFSGKLLILGATLEGAAICAILGSVSSYFYFKSNEEQTAELKNQLGYMQNSQEEQRKEINELKTYVGGMRMTQNLSKTGTPGGRSF
jgi:hypothetical protein